jgi:sugar/nucleoside kinase (ribokinase family)
MAFLFTASQLDTQRAQPAFERRNVTRNLVPKAGWGRARPARANLADDADSTATETTLGPVPIPASVSHIRIVGLGACGVDMIASVASFPSPDSKIRTTSALQSGGGNTANCMTAVRRLGVAASLVTKIGADAHGAAVVAELESDGVGVDGVIRAQGVDTPFTYVIVDKGQGTRTCVHTPAGDELSEGEVARMVDEDGLLEGVGLVVLDGRHTDAAIVLARRANERGVPVLLDVERERPRIRELIACADFVVTNSAYPAIFCGHEEDGTSGEGVVVVEEERMRRLTENMTGVLLAGRARFVVTTLGAAGSVLVTRSGAGLEASVEAGRSDWPWPVTASTSLSAIRGQSYMILRVTAWPVKDVVDTTGCGDAFVAGIAYGVTTEMGARDMVVLAGRVAAAKAGMAGARAGLPRREAVDARLLYICERIEDELV